MAQGSRAGSWSSYETDLICVSSFFDRSLLLVVLRHRKRDRRKGTLSVSGIIRERLSFSGVFTPRTKVDLNSSIAKISKRWARDFFLSRAKAGELFHM